MTEQQACTLCGAGGHTAAQCNWNKAEGALGERNGWGTLPIVRVPWNVFDRAVMWVEDRRRYGDDGTIVDDWKALKAIQRAALAQPSPAPELERPEVVGDLYLGGWADQDELEDNEIELDMKVVERLQAELASKGNGVHMPLMTVAQYDRIVGALRYKAELYDEVWELVTGKGYINVTTAISVLENERDAAQAKLAELAELEKQEPAAFEYERRMYDSMGGWEHQFSPHDPLSSPFTKPEDIRALRKLYAAPVAQAGQVPSVCDGKEQDAFEAWAASQKMDMSCHPLHWLFLNEKTYSARQGWKAALEYVGSQIAAAPAQGGE